MLSTLNILRNRRKRHNRPDARLQRGSRNLLAGCGFVLSVLLVFGIFSIVLSYQSLIKDLPALTEIENLLNPRNGALLQPTRVYDRNGALIYVFSPEDKTRRYIPLSAENPQHIPNSLVDATIALADPDFWSHDGYKISNFDPSAHPTLAQKLVFDLLLFNEKPTLRRAIRERLLAAQLTQKYGRQKIIEWYLNSANYGNYAYGAETAAQHYFDKPLIELDLAETATLAAVSQTPALNPVSAPIPALQRRQETLYIMEGLDMLDADKADAARRTRFNVVALNEPKNSAPAFLPLMLAQLSPFYPQERLERGGLNITSTLDLNLQKESACIIEAQVARWNGRNIKECDIAYLLPALPAMDILTTAKASTMILDPQNAQVLAVVGETTLNGGQSAQLGRNKAGTSLSPFIYLTGFTRGLSPASLLWDIPAESQTENFDGEFHGPVSLRVALANDYLVPMEKVLTQMGTKNVQTIAQSFGLDFDAMHSAEAMVSLSDLAQSYAVFSAEGMMHGKFVGEDLQVMTVLEVSDVEGEIWLNWRDGDSQAVISPQLAYLMNNVLSDDAARWQSLGTPNALKLGFPSAVKMGQNADGLSAWTVGYTPQRAVAVWVGADEAFDPEISAGIWQALMKRASVGLPAIEWKLPAGITKQDVCYPSGLLPTADCPNIVSEVFLNGSEPSQYDNLYRSFDINRETGFLATVFTPLELLEEKTYLLVPDEARAWAEAEGLEEPPDAYDAILAPPRIADAHFTNPVFFDDVKGVLEIRGTAAGEGFDYYRIQIGQGLKPQSWIRLGEDIHGSINDNLLAIWDTSELSGLYALQLLVVREDNSMDIATTQISIDNEIPTMKILYPEMGEVLNYQRDKQIELQVEAGDNLGVESVEFYVDFQQVGVVTEFPYVWTWATSAGHHHLKVVVRDRAGNSVEEIVRFKVEE